MRSVSSPIFRFALPSVQAGAIPPDEIAEEADIQDIVWANNTMPENASAISRQPKPSYINSGVAPEM
jgi:hypothetical protein